MFFVVIVIVAKLDE